MTAIVSPIARPAGSDVTPDDFVHMRLAMVASQLRTTAVTDPRVVAAMADVPRERFVPAAAAVLAYRDRAIDLGQGRAANSPLATGRLIVAAALRPTDRVLLIGGACGYTAAVCARLVAEIVAVESAPALAEHMCAALAGVHNASVVEGPLEHGSPSGAPFDVLLVDGAVEELPMTLVSQVVEGGRIAAGVIDRGVTRLASGVRAGNTFSLQPFVDLDAVPLPGFARPRSFTF